MLGILLLIKSGDYEDNAGDILVNVLVEEITVVGKHRCFFCFASHSRP